MLYFRCTELVRPKQLSIDYYGRVAFFDKIRLFSIAFLNLAKLDKFESLGNDDRGSKDNDKNNDIFYSRI